MLNSSPMFCRSGVSDFSPRVGRSAPPIQERPVRSVEEYEHDHRDVRRERGTNQRGVEGVRRGYSNRYVCVLHYLYYVGEGACVCVMCSLRVVCVCV